MEQTVLAFSTLMGFLHEAISEIKDPRAASNATKYKLSDAILAAFSMFFMQCQSFLEYQSYQLIRKKRGTRKGFFQDIVTLTKYLCFESWQHLLAFMLSDKPVPANSC